MGTVDRKFCQPALLATLAGILIFATFLGTACSPDLGATPKPQIASQATTVPRPDVASGPAAVATPPSAAARATISVVPEPSPAPEAEEAASVVRRYLEAEKNNDYRAWVSTLIEEKQKAFMEETNGEFGVISLTVDMVEVSDEETLRMKERYSGSDLARERGWSEGYISENMIVVSARYTVDYDNTKVPHNEGTLSQSFILIRDCKDSPWLIWDATSPSG